MILFRVKFDHCFTLNVQSNDLNTPISFILKYRPCDQKLDCIFVLMFLDKPGAIEYLTLMTHAFFEFYQRGFELKFIVWHVCQRHLEQLVYPEDRIFRLQVS